MKTTVEKIIWIAFVRDQNVCDSEGLTANRSLNFADVRNKIISQSFDRIWRQSGVTTVVPPVLYLNTVLAFDFDPDYTFDFDPVSPLVFDTSPVLNFGPSSAFDSDNGSDLDSVLCPVFNSDSVTNHSSNLDEAVGK
ncbi:hypothetical protein EVAR_7615_1 [Eumeta japonica]|uniref:Uncharacterized protein n=1 Tax=Eumeta variegata TaxID=151549 RepID=A0A4C1TLI6_EUMVA|nr:hypothetical protein EVAR_7615_1 [Eumeta japonica]